MGGIGIWQLLIVLLIIVLLFGTKKLRNMGGDLGSAFKSFKKAVNDNDKKPADSAPSNLEQKKGETIDGEVVNKEEKVQ